MRKVIRCAIVDTVPVMSGYLVLGFGFGLLMKSAGYSSLMTFVMSLLIYAGSMQYAAVGLFLGGASLLTVAITTLMVNARHIFYGISMLDKYRDTGLVKPYLIFSLTDETYSLVNALNGFFYFYRTYYFFCRGCPKCLCSINSIYTNADGDRRKCRRTVQWYYHPWVILE